MTRAELDEPEGPHSRPCAECGAPVMVAPRGGGARFCAACKADRRRAASRAWKARNPGRLLAYKAVWRAEHRGEINAEQNRRRRLRVAAERAAAPQQGACEMCGVVTLPNKVGMIPRFCPVCRGARQLVASRAWKARNLMRVSAYRSRYLLEHRDETKARARKWRQAQSAAYWRRRYEERYRATNTATMRAYFLRNPGKRAEIQNRRRARLLGVFVEAVSAAEIRERDGEICGICGGYVPVPEQSLDHIVPLARGGTHERANLQLAHRSCNSRKGARLTLE